MLDIVILRNLLINVGVCQLNNYCHLIPTERATGKLYLIGNYMLTYMVYIGFNKQISRSLNETGACD